ncbi:DUF2461 domain-containing protein [Phycicoccus sp. BSK3Z-2]|uniref:DUF2461 domain-containing protein n=1 Tax=Phycicoccus avicenniae TaxID=2828860 RepID=A0A941HY33_9MICO|nr:DUF2461 domain-containing protein [Phycicoccus avicenniae]MBR7742508.1 DUF2461 domain-containing protein [Phycicoccus avicenniae]
MSDAAGHGIPVDALDFYDDLAADNSRDWWHAHKARWESSVREPMERLCDALADEFGQAHLFRPQRDVRFSADKSPYKDHQGALVSLEAGIGWYVQVSAAGLFAGGGFYPTGPDQTRRYRAAVDRPMAGQELERLTAALVADGFVLGGERVRTRPRDVPADHPRLELLRHKHLTAARDHGAPAWLPTAEVVDRVRADWRAVRPLVEWVAAEVGPSEEPRRR